MAFRTPARICDVDQGCTPIGTAGTSAVPPEVRDEARRIAEKEYGAGTNNAKVLAEQMTALYLMAEDKDVALIFNPGGWGWALVPEMPPWATILKGMKEVLEEAGQKVMTLNYLRTPRSLSGRLGEARTLLRLSHTKGRELAALTEFLTHHRPRLKVIIAGESNGAAMSEDTMRFLRDNSRAFSVQTGTPFWAPSKSHPRSLIINHNGVEPDAFSSGNVFRCLTANIQALFGRYKGSRGNILFYIGAPGHVYNWEYDTVRRGITNFLHQTVIPSIISDHVKS